MIAIIDYGAGNIFSVKNALDYLGVENELTADRNEICAADEIILPGVGAFPWAMKMLRDSGLVDTIREEAKKKPFLGICLGMQLIFDKGYEFEETDGLRLIGGKVEKAFEYANKCLEYRRCIFEEDYFGIKDAEKLVSKIGAMI